MHRDRGLCPLSREGYRNASSTVTRAMAGAGCARHKLSNVLPSSCHESGWSSLPALPHLLRWLTLRLRGVQLSGPFSRPRRSWAAVPLPTWHRALMTGEPLPLCSARRSSWTFWKTGTWDCPSSYVNQSEAGGGVRGPAGWGGYKAVKAGGAPHSCPGCISGEGSESTGCFESAKEVRGERPEEAERGSPGSSVLPEVVAAKPEPCPRVSACFELLPGAAD